MVSNRKLWPVIVLVLASLACTLTNTPTQPPDPGPAIRVETGTPQQAEQPQALPTGAATPQPQQTSGDQPYLLKGSFSFTNDILINYYVEHMVALVDMHGFVTRDEEWEMPVESQTLGFLDLDEETLQGTFWLQLPARPTALQNDVDQDSQQEAGVQVFTLAYSPNLTGGPYSEGDDRSLGWPAYLTSARTDTENNDEVIGGELVIWSPDAAQEFPSGFGEDELLFTADDPVMPVPQGYSVIDLDESPFAIIREGEPTLTLYEPNDIQVKDFSDLSYEEAFNQMFEIVRKEYAFNGVEGKQPDWDALYAQLGPRVTEASQGNNGEAFYRVMRDFVTAFQDGHVGFNGGQIEANIVGAEIAGGYGFAIRELDDGRALVVFVGEGSPAAGAGMQRGAVLTAINGQAVGEAIAAVNPPTAPHSTSFSLRYQQARYVLRAPLGTRKSFTFTNPGGEEQTVELDAIQERESLSVTSTLRGYDPNALPVEHFVFPQGVGYVKINSSYDDLNLIIRLFQYALQTFEDNQLPAIIIDMRQNSGGANLGLAGFLTDQEIPLGQLEYYSEATGKFEPEGLPDKVLPNQQQYRFQRMILLVDQACASACELEAYAFSQVPGMVVIGQYPSAGVEAEVARGQFLLPEGMSLQVPTGRFTLPDGSLFLEGQGVVPDEQIAITETFVLAEGDQVLQYALRWATQ